MFRTIGAVFLLFSCASAAVVPSALPLVFEPNLGQVDRQAKWLARGQGYTLFLTESEAVMSLHRQEGEPPEAVRMSLAGSRSWGTGEGLKPTGGISNYFLGNDPKKWRTDIPHYSQVKLNSVYSGIDLIFYGNPQRLEYDLVVQPGADPKQIRLAYGGVKRIELAAGGDLVLTTFAGLELRQHRPRVYQEIGGRRVEVAGVYEILDRRQVAIQVAFYDPGLPLVIDPALVYSTYLGGSLRDRVLGMAVDAAGSAYLTGKSASPEFPVTSSLYPFRGGDMFVAKLNTAGNALVYSTFVGGDGDDTAWAIAVDATGAAYVGGFPESTNFPVVSAFQTAIAGGQDGCVFKLAPAGNALVYSTYLGGSGDENVYAIAVDAAGSAYVTGGTTSANFPVKSAWRAALGGMDDAFVTKLSAAGNSLVYSTYLGGRGQDHAWGIAVDSNGSAYVTGLTTSSDFPTVSPLQGFNAGASAFVTKLSPSGNSAIYSTYLGGSGDDLAYAIAVDSAGSAYITGSTTSSDFPTKSPIQTLRGRTDVFVTKLTPAGNALAYSTYLGGLLEDQGQVIAVDPAGSAYVAGYTKSTDFPTQSPYQTYQGAQDVFVAKLTPEGSALVFSTYLGGSGDDWARGIGVDQLGSVYVGGYTDSTNFPTVSPYQTDQGGTDGYVAKFEAPQPASGAPAITAVANAWSGQLPIADGAWIYLKGANLAETTRTWRASDFVGGLFPTSLDGVSVKVNNRNAYVYYISPTEITAEVPSDGATGPVPVQVTNSAGTSAAVTVEKQNTAPGVFTWPAGTATEGSKYVGAVSAVPNLDGTPVYLGKPGLLAPAGLVTRPAYPTEIVFLFATGCGPTSPAVAEGQVVKAPVPLASPVSVKIGGIPAEVYGGTGYLTFAGECQFNVRIPPSAPDGDLAVELEIGGVKAQKDIYITVQW